MLDPIGIVLTLVQAYWWVPLLLGLMSLSGLPAVKGWTGETMLHLRLVLELELERGRYHVLRDVTLPAADGGSTQIDHIVVSRHGVFVIETKNYRIEAAA